MSDDPINWFAVMTEAVAKVDAGLYQSTPRRSRDDLIALACTEAVENRLPMFSWLEAQQESHPGVTIGPKVTDPKFGDPTDV